jgi:uncharacterized protein
MNDTRALVTELLGRMAGDDPDHIAELFANQVDWAVNWPPEGHPSVPWIRPRSTRADMADLFRALREFHVAEERWVAPPTILVDGADAVVLCEFGQTSSATGRSFTSMFALRLTVRDGQVVRYHVYEDSLAIARAHDGARPDA